MATPPTSPHRKFGFDTEFFELVGGTRASGDGISAPTQPSEPDAEALRQEAYAEGHAVGLAEGQTQAQADLARLQQHLQNTLLALQQANDTREEQTLNTLLGLMQRTLTHLIGHAAQHYGPEVLEHHLRQLLPLARTDETLTLRVAPQAIGYHEKLGLPQATILGITLRVATDSTLGPVDAIMEWQHGGVEARLPEHIAELEALLRAAGAQSLPPAPLNLAATPSPAAPLAAPVSATSAALPVTEAHTALNTAAEAMAERAAALLGDDDLVDALK